MHMQGAAPAFDLPPLFAADTQRLRHRDGHRECRESEPKRWPCQYIYIRIGLLERNRREG